MRFWRLIVIAAIAVASFVLAVDRFGVAAETSCAQQVGIDPALLATWDQPPRTDVSLYRLKVTRNGATVTHARVCVNTYMVGMSAIAASDVGREVSPGIYEVRLSFDTGGTWEGQVVVAQPGRPAGAFPLKLDVSDAWGRSGSH